MTDTTPTPADRPADGRTTWPTAEPLQQAADLRRATGDPLLADWLDATANALSWLAPYRDHEPGYGMWEAALAVARQLLGTITSEGPAPAPTTAAMLATPCDACDHTLNWHRNDVGCTVPRCVCGQFQDPVEPAATPPAPADRAAEAKAATTITRLRAVIAELNRRLDCLRGDLRDMEACVREQDAEFERIRRLAADVAAGMHPPTTSEADPEGCTCGPHQLARPTTPPAAPAAPEEPQ